MNNIDNTYIADGHHRAAASYNVLQNAINRGEKLTGEEDINYFMTILYPEQELRILDYNRVIKSFEISSSHKLSNSEFLRLIAETCTVEKLGSLKDQADQAKPRSKGEFTLFLEKNWFRCTFNKGLIEHADPVKSLDV